MKRDLSAPAGHKDGRQNGHVRLMLGRGDIRRGHCSATVLFLATTVGVACGQGYPVKPL